MDCIKVKVLDTKFLIEETGDGWIFTANELDRCIIVRDNTITISDTMTVTDIPCKLVTVMLEALTGIIMILKDGIQIEIHFDIAGG
jgi:hypothetical protein